MYLECAVVVLRKENDWVPLPEGETPTAGKTGLKYMAQLVYYTNKKVYV